MLTRMCERILHIERSPAEPDKANASAIDNAPLVQILYGIFVCAHGPFTFLRRVKGISEDIVHLENNDSLAGQWLRCRRCYMTAVNHKSVRIEAVRLNDEGILL